MMKDKMWMAAMLVALAVVTSGCVSSALDSTGGQRIELNTSYFDMGDIDPDNGVRTEVFSLKNTGTNPLNIIYVSTSCGCTEAEVESDVVPPGGETKLTVRYDPSVHPGLVGRIERVVYIKSDDPINEEVELVLVGNSLASRAGSGGTDTDLKKESDNLKDYEISPEDAYTKIMSDEPAKILDVREDDEFEAGYIDGALLLSVNSINQVELDKLGLGKDDEIIVYCRSGKRSARAYEMLEALGYKNVKSMAGGINRWIEAGFPTQSKDTGDKESEGVLAASPFEDRENDDDIFKVIDAVTSGNGVCEL